MLSRHSAPVPVLSWRVERSAARLSALETVWERVHAGDDSGTPFQSFSWVGRWFRDFGGYVHAPWILLCYHDEALVGIAPMYTFYRGAPGFRRRILAFVGTAEPEDCETCAEYMDLICLPDYREACSRCLALAVAADASLHGVELVRMFADRSRFLVELLRKAGFGVIQQRVAGHRFVIALKNRRETLGLSRKTFNTLRRKRRRFMELENARVHWAEDLASAARIYAALIQLHNQRWTEAGRSGVFSNELFADFHRHMIPELLASDRLVLFSLEVAGRPVAAHYCLVEKHSVYFYQSGIDMSAYPGLSLGAVAHLMALDHCSARGKDCYDLMAGAPHGYKRRLVPPEEQPLMTTYLYPSRTAAVVLKGLRYLAEQRLLPR